MSGWAVQIGELRVGVMTLTVRKDGVLILSEDRKNQLPDHHSFHLPSYECAVEVANVIAKHLKMKTKKKK